MMERIAEFHRVEHRNDFFLPDRDESLMEFGVLYVIDNIGSVEYLCPCGCGRAVLIPVGPTGEHEWLFNETDGKVTLSPSVYSTGFPCKSHYFIRGNKILWV